MKNKLLRDIYLERLAFEWNATPQTWNQLIDDFGNSGTLQQNWTKYDSYLLGFAQQTINILRLLITGKLYTAHSYCSNFAIAKLSCVSKDRELTKLETVMEKEILVFVQNCSQVCSFMWIGKYWYTVYDFFNGNDCLQLYIRCLSIMQAFLLFQTILLRSSNVCFTKKGLSLFLIDFISSDFRAESATVFY